MRVSKRKKSTTQKMVKLRIPLPEGQWDGLEAENVWAIPLNPEEYQIQSSPFFAYGLSFDDVVSARLRDGVLTFEKVKRRGGHSTYRVLLGSPTTRIERTPQWKELEKLGCTYERANDRWLAIDAPPNANIHAVYGVLENAERSGVWSFDEGHCGHKV